MCACVRMYVRVCVETGKMFLTIKGTNQDIFPIFLNKEVKEHYRKSMLNNLENNYIINRLFIFIF